MTSVVDASVLVRIAYPAPYSAEFRSLVGERRDLVAPRLIVTEVANALWRVRKAGEIGSEDAQEALRQIPELVTLLADEDLLAEAFAIAVSMDHPVYDCLYVAAAVRLDAGLVTLDERLLRKMRAAGFGDLARHLSEVVD